MSDLSEKMPELQTDHTGSLHTIEQYFLQNREQIYQWFQSRWKKVPPPLYGSIDLRNAGFKLAPIDMNLFPAGFNNLNKVFIERYAQAARQAFSHMGQTVSNILLIPEMHTRNTFYWENIAALTDILQKAGYQVCVGSLLVDNDENQKVTLQSGGEMELYPVKRDNEGKLYVNDFIPDVIVLNNDLSEGVPDILVRVEQPVFPPVELGWSTRLKSEHFRYFAEIVEEFCETFKLDPWLLSPLFRYCGQVDFTEQAGLDCVIRNAEKLFVEIEAKYKEYQVKQKPFLVVKADSGTYGMAVMTIRSVDELKQLNRKQRTRMATIKGGQRVKRVIIQEGVYSFEKFSKDDAIAEPVVYLFGECVIGGFYRVHHQRAVDESLNVPGMRFSPIPFSQSCDHPQVDVAPDADALENRFYTYGVVAQLSMLAAAREIREQVLL